MSALHPRHDGLDWRTRAVLISAVELRRELRRELRWTRHANEARERAARARERWVAAGCPDILTHEGRVAGVLLAAAELERAQRAHLRGPMAEHVLNVLGLDTHRRALAAERFLSAVAAFTEPA